MTPEILPVMVLALVLLLSLSLWGRRWILKRREEEDLKPYRARLDERMKRRERERAEQKATASQKRQQKIVHVTRTKTKAEDGDGELMERLRKVRQL